LTFYGALFEIKLRSRGPGAAFLDMGDQFLALLEGRSHAPDRARHFGLVVDDKEALRRVLHEAGVKILPGRDLDFLDPDGNLVQVVDYRDIQFAKADSVLNGMGLENLEKTESALNELRAKGLAPEEP
jgi:hypothetical protein